jgi:D-amino peptidase
MKIYILADMEGITGIRTREQVQRDSSEYAEGCALMMAEINATVAACADAGVDTIVACDTHGGGGQIRMADMDARAVYETPNAGRMMPALDESFDGVILLGHHAKAGTLNGFLDHTMSSSHWFECQVNGQVLGEIGLEAAYAGHYGVPVVVVSGDAAACDEACTTLGEVECARVKWGIGRNRARCLPVPQAHRVIADAVRRALADFTRFKPFQPQLPATVRLTLYRSDMADSMAARPGVTRVDARTIERTITNLSDVARW